MNKKILYVIVIALFVLLFVGAAIGYQFLSDRYQAPDPFGLESGEQREDESSGESGHQETEVVMAPDFTVKDREGNSVKLSDFRGQPVVINFWATWCGPCKSELPAFEKIIASYGEEVAFLMVNLTDGKDETIEGVQEFLEKNKYELPVYFDTEYSGAIAYGVSSIPMTVFVYADGSVLGLYRGAISEEALKLYTEMIRDGIPLED
ncbi:MAG: TlpA family protein disulfide reductase [Lachnospiraceae bacterium]|nr:TlpA family protein disulfide reductase [Lachnospiraceae bacterium]